MCLAWASGMGAEMTVSQYGAEVLRGSLKLEDMAACFYQFSAFPSALIQTAFAFGLGPTMRRHWEELQSTHSHRAVM